MILLGAGLTAAPRLAAAASTAAPSRLAAPTVTHSLGQAWAAWLVEQPSGKSSSSHTDLFDWINFILLVVVLVYVLRKPVGGFFANRSAALQHDLDEGRKALEAARAQLAQAEEKLRRLAADVAGLKTSAAREKELELARLREASEAEGKRILESARSMIESATQAARQELKRTAASEAVALAEKMIRERLDEAGRARLVSRFLEGIRNNPERKTPV